MDVHSIDWERWAPKDTATLLFVIQGHRALLIRKRRGLGAGKINAPGGRLEPGESPADAAVREVIEEVRVTPIAPRPRGELSFQFTDGYSLRCHVFRSDRFLGEPEETDEATPMWVELNEIPYGEMWADDALWLPKMLAGYTFNGRFVFDGDAMVSHEIVYRDPADALFARFDALEIASRTRSHPPVFTVAEAKAHRPAGDVGVHVKNLFVYDKKNAQWLVTVPEDQAIDLASLAKSLGTKHLSFASASRLWAHLHVEPGSVTPLAAMHDGSESVRVVLDRALVREPTVHCHPLTNDRTTSLSGADLVRFLEATGHPPTLLDF